MVAKVLLGISVFLLGIAAGLLIALGLIWASNQVVEAIPAITPIIGIWG